MSVSAWPTSRSADQEGHLTNAQCEGQLQQEGKRGNGFRVAVGINEFGVEVSRLKSFHSADS